MNKTTAETSDADDWLTPLLVRDAHGDPSPQQDAAFVAQVMGQLLEPADALAKPQKPRVNTNLTRERVMLLGFQLIMVVLIVISAPTAVQAWLEVAKAPMDMTAWYDQKLWGFALGLSMMFYGSYELLNTPE